MQSMTHAPKALRSAKLLAKYATDRCVAGAGLVLLAPLLVLVGIAIRATMGRPVLFRQLRPGLRGRPFTIYKFRTMLSAEERDGQPLPDEARLTALGRWLRATSLDELPQLLNVVMGDLSLVGPRPLLMRYLPLYSREQARRHEVKPGITGWAQVHGRNAISWEEKFALDIWYVDHWSLWLDFRILWLTAAHIIHPTGISQRGHATMPEFEGGASEVSEERRKPRQ